MIRFFSFICAVVMVFLLGTPIVTAQTDITSAPAAIHFVYGSDTSTPGIDVRNKSSLYRNSNLSLFSNPSRNAYQIMSQSYRDRFRDSFGKSLKMTWWMQGGSLYRFATNTNIPFGSTMSIYLMQKHHADKVELLGDEMTFHYHTWEWSDVNKDGRFYWNQTDDFNKVKDDFMITLAEHLLEENMFPVSFRSGWHYMDNAWQATLNDWIPFSLHNNSPVHTNPTEEPINNLIDWGHATTDFIPFRPSEHNYQVGGGKGGWNTRSRSFSSLNKAEVRRMFEQAKQGKEQVAAIWGHLAENSFLQNLERSLSVIYEVADEFPDVPFHFSTAIEAMQDYLGTSDTTAPTLEVDINGKFSETYVTVDVSTDEPIFQKHPFLAIKDIYEQHLVIPMNKVGDNQWSSEPIEFAGLAKVGVAVTDSSGNLSKEIINLLLDDIYVDNDDAHFSVTGQNWQRITYNTIEHIWGDDFHQVTLSGQDSASASWTALASGTHQQQVFVRFPDVKHTASNIMATIAVNGSAIHQSTITDIRPNKWALVGIISPEENQEISVTLSAKATGDTASVFAADVIKLSPLIKERQLHLSISPYNFKEVVYYEESIANIELTNNGTKELTVNEVSSEQGFAIPDAGFPLAIPPQQSYTLSLKLTSDKPQTVQDTLTFISNDPINPTIKKEYRVEFRNYFELVDNDDKSGYSESGSWHTSSTQAYGASSRYAFFKQSETPSATYTFSVSETGYYDLAYLVPQATNSALRADYIISINGTEHQVYQSNQNEDSGSWTTLGLLHLNKDDIIKVTVKASDKNQPPENAVLRADAMRLSYMGSNLEYTFIDNENTEAYSETGAWKTSVTQAYGPSSRYVGYNTEASASFRYIAQVNEPHFISMIVPETENASRQAQYSVFVNSVKRGQRTINQNLNSGQWRALGAWSVQANDTLTVTVKNAETQNSSRVLRADAIKFEYNLPWANPVSETDSPLQFSLSQNYPNPFNPSTQISYSIPQGMKVSLTVYDILGKKVATLVDDYKTAGSYQVSFNGKNLSSGVYYYRLHTNRFTQTKALTIIK